MIRFFLLTIVMLFAAPSYPQTESKNWSFDFSQRYRFEYWNGMNARNYSDNSITGIGSLNDKILLQRIITGVTYKLHEKIEFAFHLQDARAFGWSLRNSLYPDLFKVKGQGTQNIYYKMNPGEEFLEIFDAYVEYRELFKNINTKFGRQKIFYGNYRIFGPGDWGNTGRWTWDALKISYKKNENFIDAFLGGTKTHDPLKISIPFLVTEYWGGGVYGHYKLKNVNTDAFYALKRQGSADYINEQNINRQWIGARVFKENLFGFIYDFTYVRQFGSQNNKTISAYGLVGEFGYIFSNLPIRPTLKIRESYASGGASTDKKIRTFEPAYGAADKFYGWMNIANWSNIDNREVILELFPNNSIWIEIKYNRFYIPYPDEKILLNTLKMKPGGRVLGGEYNLFLRYIRSKQWQFAGVIGYFIPKDVKAINGKHPQNSFMTGLQCLFTLREK